jgi:hypothetical protein
MRQKGGGSRGYDHFASLFPQPGVKKNGTDTFFFAPGVRYVQEEEDQVRWQDALVYALYQLQDGMRVHAGGEEEESPQRVSSLARRAIALIANHRAGPNILKDLRIV